MAVPAPFRLPPIQAALAGWMPLWGAESKVYVLAPAETGALRDTLDVGSYPSQSGPGITTVGPWTAQIESAGGSVSHSPGVFTFVIDNEVGKRDRLWLPARNVDVVTVNGRMRFKFRITDIELTSGGDIGLFNSDDPDNEANARWGLLFTPDSATTFRLRAFTFDDTQTFFTDTILETGLAENTFFWVDFTWKLRDFTVTLYSDEFQSIIGYVQKRATTGVFTTKSFGVRNFDNQVTLPNKVTLELEDVEIRYWPGSVPTNQPVQPFRQIDSGDINSEWNMPGIDIDGLDKEFIFAFGNTSNPTNFSSPLSLAALKAESKKKARFFVLQGQPDHTAGTQETFLTEGTIPVIVVPTVTTEIKATVTSEVINVTIN